MDASNIESSSVCEVQYAAFRAGFLTTLDCLLGQDLDDSPADSMSCGFLDRIPLLSSTAPQVQLQCLFQAWHRLNSTEVSFSLPIDRCVTHAAMELLAQLSLSDDQMRLKLIWRGPRALQTKADFWLYSKIRAIQVAQTPDGGSHEANPLQRLGSDRLFRAASAFAGTIYPSIHCEIDELIRTVGLWRVRPEMLEQADGLLTSNEKGVLREYFEEHPGLFE